MAKAGSLSGDESLLRECVVGEGEFAVEEHDTVNVATGVRALSTYSADTRQNLPGLSMSDLRVVYS